MNAEEIKYSLMKYIKEEFSTSEIFFEVKYGYKRRVADVLFLTENSHAVEIKSQFDSLTKLYEQLKDYSENFDYVSVAIDVKFLGKLTYLDKKIGIILVKDNMVIPIRKPKKQTRQNKRELLSNVPISVLLDHYKGKDVSVEIIRDKLAKKKLSLVHFLVMTGWRKKLSSRIYTNRSLFN